VLSISADDADARIASGEIAMIWFGGSVSPQIIDDLYGVENIDELDVRMVNDIKTPDLDPDLSGISL
jgi:hypothetical protein